MDVPFLKYSAVCGLVSFLKAALNLTDVNSKDPCSSASRNIPCSCRLKISALLGTMPGMTKTLPATHSFLLVSFGKLGH